MSHYTHLTISEREMILSFRIQGKSISFIARKLNRSKSTISRELKRNSFNDEYWPSKAQASYHSRREKCRPHHRLENPSLFSFVRMAFLEWQWSPQQIAERLRLEHGKCVVSYATIYRSIYSGLFDTQEERRSHGHKGAIRKLRHRGKSRHTKEYEERRGKFKASHPLSERPEAANKRQRIGDWEFDTVVGKKDRACLVTGVDRKSRFLKVGRSPNKQADNVNAVMIEMLKNEPCYTLTPDRGSEFKRHEIVAKELGVEFYFPEPHQPWQRGTNENTNGLLREYFPKKYDVTDLEAEEIQEKVDKLNKRPRKVLGYRTPYEIYYSVVLHLT